MRTSLSLALLLTVLLLIPGNSLQGATITLGVNGLINGDAESGAGSSDGSIVPVPGWTPLGDFTAVQYGAAGGFPTVTDPGPVNRGSNFFAGGPNSGTSSGSQLLDVSNISGLIDAGTITFLLSGYLGGFDGQGDNATLTANFLNASSANIGSATIGPVTVGDRASATGLLLRTTSGAIPTGTRSINFLLQMNRQAGAYNDGYADNLSFVATSTAAPGVPEPGTMGTLAVGFGALALLVSRRGIRTSHRPPRSE